MGYENYTTHIVWNEVSNTGQREHVQPFIDSGLIRLQDIAPDAWEAIYAFSNDTGVSVPDSSVWLLAHLEGAILLTGDSKLRKSARATDVEVRGILWVLDELVEQSKISSLNACEALEAIRKAGGFLPADECQKRLTKWAEK